MDLPYANIPDPPTMMSAGNALLRMIDGLGFRFRWATEGLTAEQYDFRAGEGIFTIREAMGHILFLVERINRTVGGTMPDGAVPITNVDGSSEQGPPPADPDELRRLILGHVQSAAERAAALDADQVGELQMEIMPGRMLPIWNMLNGPLADALTHVGQINTWRRMAGNPTPKANVLYGRPPKPV